LDNQLIFNRDESVLLPGPFVARPFVSRTFQGRTFRRRGPSEAGPFEVGCFVGVPRKRQSYFCKHLSKYSMSVFYIGHLPYG
jgi:hypothetical protein